MSCWFKHVVVREGVVVRFLHFLYPEKAGPSSHIISGG